MIARIDDRAILCRTVRLLVCVTLVASSALTVPLYVFLPSIVRLFFGEAFLDCVGPGRILLAAAVVLSSNRVLTVVFRAIGRPMDAGIAEAIALGVTVVGLGLLLKPLGLIGAATTSFVAYLVSTIWMLWRAGRHFELPIRVFLFPGRDALPLLRQLGAIIAGRKNELSA
jgi:O-antigen/teichoic acid export membrane protein